MNNSLKKITKLSILTSIIALVSPISIYVGVIPFSLSLLIIFIISATFSLKETLIVIFLYLLLGFIGIPVFAGFKNGYEVITNATLGYIIGYIPCAIVINLVSHINKNNILYKLIGMIIGLIICYIFAVIFYMIIYKTNFLYACSLLIVPFIIIDIIKILIASLCSISLNKYIKMDSSN